MHIETAAKVWVELCEWFSQSNILRIYQIHQEMNNLKQAQSSVETYYTKLKGMWDKISTYVNIPPCLCRTMKVIQELQQQERIMQFLMGRNASYSAIHNKLLLMTPLLNLSKAYALIVQEE
jgi:hypothetical protein